jgi:hypothetical protein
MVRVSDAIRFRGWLARWGFAVAVGIAIGVGLLVGITVHIPAAIPNVALQAAAVYRLEVGGAIFVGFYLAAMAFVLALRNRGFTDIGTAGVRVRSLDGVPEALRAQEISVRLLQETVAQVRDLAKSRGER